MIPLKLKLKGVYSYQQEQSVDFTKLTQANIFGIFGQVGCGKSTILESIAYALYGKTDRLNEKGDDRNYNMMNLKSNELNIEFTFKAGKDDKEYMIKVNGKRNKKKFGDVKSFDRTAYEKKAGVWEPIDPDKIEEIIGLSYENFKRTIIIPQGQFQEFLQLGHNERSKMLKELFNLEKFELSAKVSNLEKKNKETLNKLEGQLIHLGNIDPDQIKSKEKELETLSESISSVSKELEDERLKDNDMQKLKDLYGKLQTCRNKYDGLKKDEATFEMLEKNIKEYEECIRDFRQLFDQRSASVEKITKLESNIASSEEELKKLSDQLEQEEQSFINIKKEYENRGVLKQKAEELDKIARLLELNKNISEDEEKINSSHEKLNELTASESAIRSAKEKCRLERTELNAQCPDITKLSDIRNWHVKNNSFEQQRNEAMSEKCSIEEEILTLGNSVTECRSDELSGIPKTHSISEINVFLDNKKNEFQEQINGLEVEIEQLNVRKKLHQYVVSLENGQPCPLCGALDHPQILLSEDVEELLKTLNAKKKELKKRIQTVEEVQSKLENIKTKLEEKQKQLKTAAGKLSKLETQLAEHNSAYAWEEEYRDETILADRLEKGKSIKNTIDKIDKTIEKLEKDLERAQGEIKTAADELNEIKAKLTKDKTEREVLKSQITLLDIKEYEGYEVAKIKELRSEFLGEYEDRRIKYEKTDALIKNLSDKKAVLSGGLSAKKEESEREKSSLDATEQKIKLLLKKSGRTDEKVREVLFKKLDVDRERKRLEAFRQNLKSASDELTNVRKEIGERQYDEAHHKVVANKITELGDSLKILNQSLGGVQNEIKKMKADLEEHKRLIKEKEVLLIREENIQILKKLFKANGFVNFISTVYLQDLCNTANSRFRKMTSQKLGLEVTEENDFQVRDNMNGGNLRHVKTLSGGQTFQAALSLALALSDSIQKMSNSDQSFFFLDEGFGSLDKESLNIVFDTLKALRKENRIVGVISHVEEMQQEIDTHLKIINDAEQGSIIRASWN